MRHLAQALALLRSGRLRRGAVHATLTTTMVNLLVLAINLGTGLLTARFLGPEGRGELAAMILWPQFLASLLTLGLPQAATFHLVRQPEQRAGITAVLLVASLLLGAVVALAGIAVIPAWTGQYEPGVVAFAQGIMVYAPLILFMWAVNACLQAQGAFHRINRNLLLQPALALLGLGLLGALGRLTPFTAAAATVLAPLPVYVRNAWWLWRHHRPAWVEPRANAARLLRYGLRSWGVQLLGALSAQFDRVFVLSLLSPAAMGLYVVARNAAQPTRLFADALNTVLFPKASALEADAAVDLTLIATRVGLVAAAIIAVPLVLLGPRLLTLVYGAEFVTAGLAFQLLLVEGALTAVTTTMVQAFMSVERPEIATLLRAVAFAATLAFLTALVPPLGIVGAALALLAAAILRLLLTMVCFPLILGVRLPRLWLSGGDLRLILHARGASA